jgi:hypothetical protein
MHVKLIAALATLLGVATQVIAAPSPPSIPQVTVVAPRPPTPEELAGTAVPDFVKSHSSPSIVIGQLTRWRRAVCPLTRGLDPDFNAFITARIRAVAAVVGAPHEDSPDCKPNIEILFTLEPQQVIDAALKQDSRILGFHYAGEERRLATMTRPIQGWYVTSTRNYTGVEAVDDPLPLGSQQSGIDATGPAGFIQSKVPPGRPGSRLTNLRTSQVVLATIVVDANKIKGMAVGPLSDYLAMLVLTQTRSFDACSQLPTIMDLLAPNCDDSRKPTQITAGDLAFLRALYRANLETPVDLEQSDIEFAMQREFQNNN